MADTWRHYENATYGFALDYPGNLVVMAEDQSLAKISPLLLFRVRFLDRQLAQSETAQLQPPNLSVEVLRNSEAVSLDRWLDENTPGGSRTPVSIGQDQGIKVVLPLLMAPNEFFYFVSAQRVYRLTLLIPSPDEVLRRFHLI